MDVVVDNSSLSVWAEDAALLGRVLQHVVPGGTRLAVPVQTIHEMFDSPNETGVAGRVQAVVAMADQLGSRFIITQDVRDIVEIERNRRLTSTPRVDPKFQEDVIHGLRDRQWWTTGWSGGRELIRKQQNKDALFARDKQAAIDLRPRFASRQHRISEFVDRMRADDWFWTMLFMSTVSDRGRYTERIRANPRRYSAAVMAAAYATLNLGCAIFQEYGAFAHLLGSPRRGDWTDANIATCAAYAKVLLTEDRRQCHRSNHIAQQFGLRVRATTTEAWLASN